MNTADEQREEADQEQQEKNEREHHEWGLAEEQKQITGQIQWPYTVRMVVGRDREQYDESGLGQTLTKYSNKMLIDKRTAKQ